MPGALLESVPLVAGKLVAALELSEGLRVAVAGAAGPLDEEVLELSPVGEPGRPVMVRDAPLPLETDVEVEVTVALGLPEPAGRSEVEGTEVSEAVGEAEVMLELASSTEPSSSSNSHSSQSLLSSTLARNSDGFCGQLEIVTCIAHLFVLPLPEHERPGPLEVVQSEALAEVVGGHKSELSARARSIELVVVSYTHPDAASPFATGLPSTSFSSGIPRPSFSSLMDVFGYCVLLASTMTDSQSSYCPSWL